MEADTEPDQPLRQPTYVEVWMINHDILPVCRASRTVTFHPGHSNFLRALQEAWQGVFDPTIPFNSAVINMDLWSGHLSGSTPPFDCPAFLI